MERLTYDFCVGSVHCNQVRGADNLECGEVCQRQDDDGCATCPIARAFDRLVTIEDILGDEYDLDRLRELVQADREGRCVVLKFAPGSRVYRVWFNPSNGKFFVTEHIMKSKEMCLEAELWNDAYKTREEAEKALEEMEGNGNG